MNRAKVAAWILLVAVVLAAWLVALAAGFVLDLLRAPLRGSV